MGRVCGRVVGMGLQKWEGKAGLEIVKVWGWDLGRIPCNRRWFHGHGWWGVDRSCVPSPDVALVPCCHCFKIQALPVQPTRGPMLSAWLRVLPVLLLATVPGSGAGPYGDPGTMGW